MLDWQLFGNDAGKHHLTNLVLHIANSLLLFAGLKKLTAATWRSAFVAALFALHPSHVESVAWVAERKDVLCALFFMLTLLAYAKYAGAGEALRPKGDRRESDNIGRRKSPIAYGFALLFFALGLMAKPMLVTLPFVLLLLDLWPLRRVSGLKFFDLQATPPRQDQKAGSANWPFLLLEKIPFLVLSAISSKLTVWAQGSAGAIASLNKMPLGSRIANAMVSYGHYLETFFWPKDLASPYPYPGFWPASRVSLVVIVLVTLLFLAAWIFRRQPFVLVGYLWFLGMLVPVIGFVQVGAQAYADRYSYLPTIGLSIAVTWATAEILRKMSARPIILAIGIPTIVIACAASTSANVQQWKNTGTLFTNAIAKTKNNAFAHNNLGVYLLERGQYAEAVQHAQSALEIVPSYPDPHSTLAFGYYMLNQMNKALPEYEKALQFETNNARLYNGYGAALGTVGKLPEACDIFKKSIALNPEQPEAHHNLAFTLVKIGKNEEAISHYQEAVRLDPNYAMAYYNMGNAYLRLGKIEQAKQGYMDCLRLKPDFLDARKQLEQIEASRK